ncbi:hypothetical protein BJ742DRAFT_871831 [Cladochytrium replicatum]|nr:hypothetical protein BJ742DRAFT_871831 [Cladochytrium replicatum]
METSLLSLQIVSDWRGAVSRLRISIPRTMQSMCWARMTIYTKSCTSKTSSLTSTCLPMRRYYWRIWEILVRHQKHWMADISKTWKCRKGHQRHDFFVSYRHATDTEPAERIARLLEESAFHVFLDKQCLMEGQEWERGFRGGILNSSVILLLCSDSGLKDMEKAHIGKGDNVLLEWELALEMNELYGTYIVPIFLPSVKQTPTMLSWFFRPQKSILPFSLFHEDAFPNERHAHRRSPKKHTIRETFSRIMRFHGVNVNQFKFDQVITKAYEINRKLELAEKFSAAAEARQHEMIEQSENLIKLPAIFLPQDKLNMLKKWLNPLTNEMEAEYTRLISDYLPGTRKWLIEKIMALLSPKDPAWTTNDRVLWVSGTAGVGKSVMAALIAHELQAQNLLGGMFFCKHDDDERNNGRNIILTLAFALCQWNIDFGKHLFEIMNDPVKVDVVRRSHKDMFKMLISAPLTLLYQKEKVKLIITGRPEADIMQSFDGISATVLSPTDTDNRKDAELFAKHFLSTHPAEESAIYDGPAILEEKSNGVFIWLIMACNELHASYTEKITIEMIENLPNIPEVSSSSEAKIAVSLNSMFKSTFNRIFSKEGENSLLFKVFSAIVMAVHPLSAQAVCELFQENFDADADAVANAIRILSPVLILDGSNKLRVFHKSVKDYLTSHCKDIRYAISEASAHEALAERCIAVLLGKLSFNMCRLPLNALLSEYQTHELNELIQENIPEHVHFDAFLSDLKRKSQNKQNLSNNVTKCLKELFGAKSLQWLEVMSLLGSMDDILKATAYLTTFVQLHNESSSEFSLLLDDIRRATMYFYRGIKMSALQVYYSAVLFSPPKSLFKESHISKLPASVKLPHIIRGSLDTWPSTKTLEGHLDISASYDKTVRTWNAMTGQQHLRMDGHTRAVNSAVFSKDGMFVVSASSDKTLRIWDAKSGEELKKLQENTYNAKLTVFSPDGKFVLSSRSDETVSIWDVASGRKVHSLIALTGSISSLFNPDRAYIVSGGPNMNINILNTLTGGQTCIQWNFRFPEKVSFSANGNLMVSIFRAPYLSIWDTITGKLIRELTICQEHKGIRAPVPKSACLSADGKYTVSALSDNTIRMWETEISPDGKFVVSSHSDGLMCVWDRDIKERPSKPTGHLGVVTLAELSPDQKFVASASYDRTIRIWDTTTGDDKIISEKCSYNTSSIRFSPDGTSIVSASDDSMIRIWNLETAKEIWKEYHLSVLAAAFSIDGRFVISADRNNCVRIWDISAKVELKSYIFGSRRTPVSATMYLDESFVVYSSETEEDRSCIQFAGYNGELSVWDIRKSKLKESLAVTGQDEKALLRHTNGRKEFAFFKDNCCRLVSSTHYIMLDENKVVFVRFPT